MKNQDHQEISPSIIHCWWIINRLLILKDLMRHDTRWAPHIPLARPLKKLGIDVKDQYKHQKINEKINNLIPIAQRASSIAQVSTIVSSLKMDYNDPQKLKEKEYDLLVHYKLLMAEDRPTARYFELTMDLIDQIIGYFKELRFRKLINLLNPLYLIAIILRIPITILEYMGFNTRSVIAEKVINFIWIFILAIILVLLGEKSEVVSTFVKLILSKV